MQKEPRFGLPYLEGTDLGKDIPKNSKDLATILADALTRAGLAPDRGDVVSLLERLGVVEGLAQGDVLNYGTDSLAAFKRPHSAGSRGTVIALGRRSMQSMTNVKNSIAIGIDAMASSTISWDNIAIGSATLKNVQADSDENTQAAQQGTRNIALGSNGLLFLTRGYSNISMGRNANQCQVEGRGTVALGYGALAGYAPIGLSGAIENWSPWGNGQDDTPVTAVGYRALEGNTANNNTALGGFALQGNKKSSNNTAAGAYALGSIDRDAGYGGGVLTALAKDGTYTQAGTTITMTIAAHGLVVGDTVYFRLIDGAAQTFQFDQIPGKVISVPNANTFTLTSPKSLNTAGTSATYRKESAAQAPTASNNTAFGYNAGKSVTSGTRGVFVGSDAAPAMTAAPSVTAVGSQALVFATDGGNSCAIGYFAAGNISSADRVTALGSQSLRNKIDGTAMTDAFANIVGVGAYTAVSGANQVQLGVSSQTTYAYGAVQNRSDARDKADVRDTALGLEFVNALRPRDWRWDYRESYVDRDDAGEVVGVHEKDGSRKGKRFHHGLIAQEVAEVLEEQGVDFGGFQDHKVAGGDDVYSIGYEELIAPLIKAVQELSARVKDLEGAA